MPRFPTARAGGSISADAEANEALYGQGAEAGAILGGRVRQPPAFSALYEELGEVLAGAPLEAEAAAVGSLDTPDAARVSDPAFATQLHPSTPVL